MSSVICIQCSHPMNGPHHAECTLLEDPKYDVYAYLYNGKIILLCPRCGKCPSYHAGWCNLLWNTDFLLAYEKVAVPIIEAKLKQENCSKCASRGKFEKHTLKDCPVRKLEFE